MSRERQGAVVARGPRAFSRLQPSDTHATKRPIASTIECVPGGNRLLRVLVADDNKDAADSLSRLVTIWGHDVRLAYGGAAALELACTYRPDVLLLDIAMLRMDGCRLAQQLRLQASCKDALLVAITGYADEAHHLLCEKAGFDHFLIKPAEPSAVATLLLLRRDWLAESWEDPRVPLQAYAVSGRAPLFFSREETDARPIESHCI